MDYAQFEAEKTDIAASNDYYKLLIGSLLTLAMAWGISLGDTALEKSHIISHNDQEVQLAKDLPFEY